MSLVRSKAGDWASTPNASACSARGGHLTAFASTKFDKRRYEPIDSIDQVSCRPDFTILIYPAYLVGKGKTELRPDIRVTKDTPPTFFAHASNDGVSSENSVGMVFVTKRAA